MQSRSKKWHEKENTVLNLLSYIPPLTRYHMNQWWWSLSRSHLWHLSIKNKLPHACERRPLWFLMPFIQPSNLREKPLEVLTGCCGTWCWQRTRKWLNNLCLCTMPDKNQNNSISTMWSRIPKQVVNQPSQWNVILLVQLLHESHVKYHYTVCCTYCKSCTALCSIIAAFYPCFRICLDSFQLTSDRVS